MSGNLVKVGPQVLTQAQPAGRVLVGARTVVQQTPAIQELFIEAREQKWEPSKLAEQLQGPLQAELEATPAEVVQVCQYLADEYAQLGDESLLLVSPETGELMARITEADLWQPPDVPREDGSMATPLKRIRPDLEGFIIHWNFERAREKNISTDLAAKLNQSAALATDGDRRLLPVTRKGRKQIVDEVRELLSGLLPGGLSGVPRGFLEHFEFRVADPVDSKLQPLLKSTAIARDRVGIQDPKAMNLRFDRVTNTCSRIATQWCRQIARDLAIAADTLNKPERKRSADLHLGDLLGCPFWIGEPDVGTEIQRVTTTHFLPVEACPTTGLRGHLGIIVIDPFSYKCEGRELFDRWDVVAQVEYTLWVDFSRVRSLRLMDVPILTRALIAE